ncbi:molybdopterin-dependent oxidoreductase [Chloroflexota bacterium]
METIHDSSQTRKIRTICPFCPNQDGIIATVQNGRITKLEGDSEHPVSRGYSCIKARHAWEGVYHPHRFKQPLLRTVSGWKEISWEEALDVAAERLNEVKNKFGPFSLCAANCTPNAPEGIALTLLTRALGSPNQMNNRDLCQGTHEVADMVTFGHVLSIYQSAQDFRNSRCILLVGTNMAESASGQWQDILHARKNGAKLIVVDPRRCESAKQADTWLQIRPGTDGALGLGMLHVIINEGLYDADFVNTYCLGFEKLREHVQQYTPEKVAEITSLSPQEIVLVARTFATNRPASYRGNIGLSQYSNSTQAARTFSMLTAITGNIDVPGGNLVPRGPSGYGSTYRLLQSTRLPREVEEERLGAKRFPLWSGPDSLIDIAHNPFAINAIITGEPYPVKSMIINGANPVLTYPDTRKVIEALRKLEFLIVIAYTPSPTSELADLILPTQHRFEQNRVTFSGYGSCVSAMPKLIEAPAGCFDPIQILYRLSDKMAQKGYIQKNLIPWKDMDELTEWRISQAEFSFADLCEKGPIAIERQYRKYVERGFRTPSGKVELYSARMESNGYDPLPVFREPVESPLLMPKLAENYPLILTTRRIQSYYLSRSAEESWLRELMPYPQLQIHPSAAQERGIQQGDIVVVETPRGTFRHLAELTEDIHPQVVNGVFGWWLPEKETPEEGSLETNVNAAMSYDPPCDPVVGINSVQGLMCQVGKL